MVLCKCMQCMLQIKQNWFIGSAGHGFDVYPTIPRVRLALCFLAKCFLGSQIPFYKHYHRARGLHGDCICKSIPQETALNGMLEIRNLSVWSWLGQKEQNLEL